ncbi:MAG: hypothetical protein HN368_20760 [Spirochaetales bacterium]|jgi:hypothetical protein|nr:hypothetical protein [Spirochaetales bacterium]
MSTSNSAMPIFKLGDHKLSKLIIGSNPIHGGSHLSRFVNNQMKEYFSPQRIQEFLSRCESLGINAWQGTPNGITAYREHRRAGGNLKFISLVHDRGDNPADLKALSSDGVIACAYHGEETDRLFKVGKLDDAKAYISKIRDAGMLAGVSTHMPDVIDYVESAGWEPDFYMTCVYERHRTREELRELLGKVPLPLKEVYLEEDPPRMWAAINKTDKPCLSFKILAAGRVCDRQKDVEEAFRTTFRNIKPNDGVIVGMYPQYEDQAALNASYVESYGI